MMFDARKCTLGEGAFWHPSRKQFFWFDILGRKMLTQEGGVAREYAFDRMASAAGWLSQNEMLIATETGFLRLNLTSGTTEDLLPLEAENPITRSNDGRADPFGGFWIGTMGKQAEPGAGAIYRLYKGQIRQLFDQITISNSICFAPDGSYAHFSDTAIGQVFKVALDAEGWPKAAAEVFLDLRAEGLNPDGAVLDAAGDLWLAQWGASRVACYGPDGSFKRAVEVGAPHASCPAFGGADMKTLFVTTAMEGMDDAALTAAPQAGMVFAIEGVAKGQAEHQVRL